MGISELIKPGDKIDLKLLQQAENAEMNNKTVTVYKSQVLDKRENGNFIISMPIQNGRLILLSLGVRYELTFFCQNSMYRCIGQVIDRYKKDNLCMLEIELKTPLERYQRREFYRYDCTLDFKFYVLDEELKKRDNTEEIINVLMDDEYREKCYQGITVNISGGGMKFKSDVALNTDDRILIVLRLMNERMDSHLQVFGKVIGCEEVRIEKMKFYESRIQFQIKENRIREEIIRYIFEEERKIRRKENR